MLEVAGIKGGEIVGEVSSLSIQITAYTVAVNAVMAGCLPEYMPVLLSAVRGICLPEFGYHGIAFSTGRGSIVTVVNGPIAKGLGINCEENVLGLGFRPNVTIGRALQLLMMNTTDTPAGKIPYCFAENEEISPWEPLHVERGYHAEESTTTVFASESVIQTYNQLSRTPEPLLLSMADAIANMGSRNIIGQQDVLVVFGGEHAEIFRDNGWDKGEVKHFLFGHARRKISDLKRAGRLPGEVRAADETSWRHVVRSPESIVVVCAGGMVGCFSACMMGWGSYGMTRSITTPVVVL
jgi:hypothetical protein